MMIAEAIGRAMRTAEVAQFAMNLQQLERRMWALFHNALGTINRVRTEFPTDYNLADVAAELTRQAEALLLQAAAGAANVNSDAQANAKADAEAKAKADAAALEAAKECSGRSQ